MIVYLHGFRSSPASRKATMLRDQMAALGRASDIQCPQLPESPRAAVSAIIALVSRNGAGTTALIGSSLGGFYATCVAEQVGCRAALLNPAIAPYRDLRVHVGPQPVYFSSQSIDFRPEYLDELRELNPKVITHPDRYFLVAATGDDVIDYRSMIERFAGARQRVIEGSNHELSDFADVIDEVLAFCGVHTAGNEKGKPL